MWPPVQLESLPLMVRGVYSEDPQQQLEATTQFRKLLSIGMGPQLWRRIGCSAPGSRSCSCRAPHVGTDARLVAERNPPIEEVISQGVIPRFVQFLQRSDMPPLQVRRQLMSYMFCCAHFILCQLQQARKALACAV